MKKILALLAFAAILGGGYSHGTGIFYRNHSGFLDPVGENQSYLGAGAESRTNDKPNVLLIVVDDLGFNDVTFTVAALQTAVSRPRTTQSLLRVSILLMVMQATVPVHPRERHY